MNTGACRQGCEGAEREAPAGAFMPGRWRAMHDSRGRLCHTMLVLVLIGLPPAVPGQTPPATRGGSREVRVAASEERLWLARIRDGQTELSYRGPGETFERAEPFNAPIASLTAAGRAAYVFRADGSFYRYSAGWPPALALPDRQRPTDLIGVDQVLYGLLPSALAARLPFIDPTIEPPTSRPFDPGAAAMSLVRYDGRGWSAVAPCAFVPSVEDSPARLCHAGDRLAVFWQAPDAPQISYAWFDLTTQRWSSGGTLGVPGVTAFWVVNVNRMLTLICAMQHAGGVQEIATYVLVSRGQPESVDSWEPANFELSPLAGDAGAVRYVDAFGFNQHLGLLALGTDGAAYVRFGRLDGPAVMPTINVFAEQAPPGSSGDFQTVRALIVLAVLGGLMIFRRGSIVTPVRLPPGLEVAFAVQRLGGAAVDLVPFALVAALLLRVDVSDGFGQLLRWAFDPSMRAGLPPALVIVWWSVSAAAYTTYSLVMELVTRRTVGKRLLRTEVLAESGQPPAAWQIVARNLFRFIEIMPPFWILGFLVVLSRNRQRAGDIFARTVLARRVTPSEQV